MTSVFPIAPTVQVYEKDGVTLTMSCEKQSATGLTVTLTASNSTESDISSLTLQAAVPKVCNEDTLVTDKLTAPASFLCWCWNVAAKEYLFFVLWHFQYWITHTDTLSHLLSLCIWAVCVGCWVSALDPVMFSVVSISAVNGGVFWCFKLQSSIWSSLRVSSYTWRPPVGILFLLEAQLRWPRWWSSTTQTRWVWQEALKPSQSGVWDISFISDCVSTGENNTLVNKQVAVVKVYKVREAWK